MPITEQSVIDQISVDLAGNISVRRDDQVLRDGAVIASNFHRHVLTPGDDLTGQDARVVAVATAIWTPEAMKARTAEVVAQAAKETAERNAAINEAKDTARKLEATLKEIEAALKS
jgi:hypothetical protein